MGENRTALKARERRLLRSYRSTLARQTVLGDGGRYAATTSHIESMPDYGPCQQNLFKFFQKMLYACIPEARQLCRRPHPIRSQASVRFQSSVRSDILKRSLLADPFPWGPRSPVLLRRLGRIHTGTEASEAIATDRAAGTCTDSSTRARDTTCAGCGVPGLQSRNRRGNAHADHSCCIMSSCPFICAHLRSAA